MCWVLPADPWSDKASFALPHAMFTVDQRGKYSHHMHFPKEQTEAQNRLHQVPRSHSHSLSGGLNRRPWITTPHPLLLTVAKFLPILQYLSAWYHIYVSIWSISINEKGVVRYLIKEVEKIRCECEEEKAMRFSLHAKYQNICQEN